MILITGATGFIGGAVVRRLVADDAATRVAVAVRHSSGVWSRMVREHVVSDMTSSTDWSVVLADVSAVVHCAARVHVMQDRVADPLVEFRKVNVQGTLNLARQAAEAGVG